MRYVEFVCKMRKKSKFCVWSFARNINRIGAGTNDDVLLEGE